MAQINFNARLHEPSTGSYDSVLIPDGTDVQMMVIESTFDVNSKHTGKILKFTYEVVAPPQYAGARKFDNFNLLHENPKTQAIANREFSALCHACQLLDVMDSEQLHGKVFQATMGVEKNQNGEDRNKIKKYLFSTPAQATTPQPQPATQPAPQPQWGTPPAQPAWGPPQNQQSPPPQPPTASWAK